MQFIEGIDDDFLSSRSVFNTEKKLVFDPLVYEQRYLKTSKILSLEKFRSRIKNIVEFGVAELKFFVYMKNGLKHAKNIDLVDIDGELLNRFKSRVDPLIVDHLKRREEKLTARVWKGSVAVPNANFKNADAVVAIELIEHVFPDVLEEIPFQIFGIIKPKIVILTTPNGEFNVLFDLKPGSFRHWDHKFEWTRAEFEDWCNNICDRFPDYCVQFHGIGRAPDGFEHLGCCSQLGFFIRKDFLNSLDAELMEEDEVLGDSQSKSQSAPLLECDDYELLHKAEYPYFHDSRSRDEKILDECRYHIDRFRWLEEDYMNYELDRIEIPLKFVAKACWELTDNIEEIRSILQDEFTLENDILILPANEREESEEEFYQEENQYEEENARNS